MPNPNNYTMDYRPRSYWESEDSASHLILTVKGELRRQVAQELANEGVLDPVISAESLTDENRDAVGAVHPWLMGGEFLSDLLPQEVEIARIILKSTTMDVISIRARRVGKRISYRIVDEYYEEGLFEYHLSRKSSTRPLTMKQLIELIDNAQERGGLMAAAREWNYEASEGDAEEYYNFASISSEFYPQIADWYDEANEEWLDARLFERTGMTKAERLEEEYRSRYFDYKDPLSAQEKEWREKNKKQLQAERKEQSVCKKHHEYKNRYKKRAFPKTLDEMVWRSKNQDSLNAEIDFNEKVRSCMSKAKWQVGPGCGGAWGAAIKVKIVRDYVENYIRKNGKPPIGDHVARREGSNPVKVKFQK